jgi:hypothetical protein
VSLTKFMFSANAYQTALEHILERNSVSHGLVEQIAQD